MVAVLHVEPGYTLASRQRAVGGRHTRHRGYMMGLLCATLLAGLWPWWQVHAEAFVVEVLPLILDPEQPQRQQFGPLTLLKSFELRSSHRAFGGFSGLALSPDGQQFYAVSDRGYWFSAHLQLDATGRLMGFDDWHVVRLRDQAGQPLRRVKKDAEALVRDRDGAFLIAFEQQHRVWRYPASPTLSIPPQVIAMPPELQQAPRNGGIEAMTRLPNGDFLVLTEEFFNPDGSLKGWLLGPNYFTPVVYVTSEGFQPTDLATLANGDVLILERRYQLLTGAAARVLWLSSARIHPEARLQGEELVRLTRPLAVDNFEGLAVHEAPSGEITMYMISDNNFHRSQRTLLLQFRLDTPHAR